VVTQDGPPSDNGMDHNAAELIITAGIRNLAKGMHPDTSDTVLWHGQGC